MVEPNEKQQQLIENIDGIYVVDAGAGTGKTFTITRRYVNILDNGVKPGDILLATFTNNAADQMKERIVQKSDVKPSRLYDAPISTFHALSKKILKDHGVDAPRILGIDDSITQNVSVMESQVRERQEFQRFIDAFVEEHPEYEEFYRVVNDYSELLDLINNLASKGVIPTAEGWFRNTEEYLDGDFAEFKAIFDEANRPRESSNGTRQSDLRSRLYSFDYKLFTSDAPEIDQVRGDRGTKQVRKDFARKAFNENREDLKDFVHDLYYSYMKYALSRNYLNFNLLMVFAYVLLHEDHRLREKLEFEYVMVDEFQDTNEIQFKLALLLSGADNICVVGDWKQSIYSFQYASVENIKKFEKRLERYVDELNTDETRVNFPVLDVEKISLEENYRSTQDILDLSEQALLLPATDYERLKEDRIKESITSLKSNKDLESRIEAFHARDEVETVLGKIQDVVGNKEYAVDGEEPDYGDIAILTRTRSFGLELQKKAVEYGVPVAYEGGVELFKTKPAILLLAWMRILNSNADRGWAVALEETGYTLDEAKTMLEEEVYPDDMLEFREELESLESIGAVADTVFQRYGFSNGFTAKIIEVLQNAFETSYMNLGELIQFVEDNIESGEIYEVDNSLRENVVKIQTIHAAKGLEYPIVFVSDVNQSRFPSTNSSNSVINYRDPVGLRMKKRFDSSGVPYSYDNWRTEILFKSLSGEYDEERRLMYVAMTRAEQHLFISAETGNESKFFEELDIEKQQLDLEPDKTEVEEPSGNSFVSSKGSSSPVKKPVHYIMDAEFEGELEHGIQVHSFAEKYASGEKVEPENEDEQNVKEFIDSLEGEKLVEETVLYPLKPGELVLEGRPDLVNISEKAKVIDFKTDRGSEEYRKQLSVYHRALEEALEREVESYIFYTSTGELERIEPLEREELLPR